MFFIKDRVENNDHLFHNRDERAKFITKVFKNYLVNSILDVGCGNNDIKKYLPNTVKYIGIDNTGNPDFKIDLEKDKLKTFSDEEFYTVICTEVLEHLDNLHEIFDDLCRVSKRFIIISVPNAWRMLKFMIQGSNGHKFYGLPLNKPKDRHKWFFNYEQALDFFKKRGDKNNFKIRYHFHVPIKLGNWKFKIYELVLKLLFEKKLNQKNLHTISLWVLLEKNV